MINGWKKFHQDLKEKYWHRYKDVELRESVRSENSFRVLRDVRVLKKWMTEKYYRSWYTAFVNRSGKVFLYCQEYSNYGLEKIKFSEYRNVQDFMEDWFPEKKITEWK